MLTYREIGQPIAITDDDRVVYLDTKLDRKKRPSIDNVMNMDIMKNVKDKGELRKILKRALAEDIGKTLELKEDSDVPIHQYPNPNKREICYICGPAGSGKSTICGRYIAQYKEMFPKNKVFVFSRLLEDEPLDRYKPIRIILDETMLDDPIDLEDLENSLVVFDDIDTIMNKKINDAVYKLTLDIMESGRKMKIYCLITSHLITKYRKSRCVLNEMNFLTVFPRGGSAYQIKDVCKRYIGMSKKDVDKLLATPSRWVTIHKNYPQYVLHRKGVYLL